MQLTIRAVSIRASGFAVLSETLETLNPQARTLHVTRVLLHPRLLLQEASKPTLAESCSLRLNQSILKQPSTAFVAAESGGTLNPTTVFMAERDLTASSRVRAFCRRKRLHIGT